jgi:hypothetical protein
MGLTSFDRRSSAAAVPDPAGIRPLIRTTAHANGGVLAGWLLIFLSTSPGSFRVLKL